MTKLMKKIDFEIFSSLVFENSRYNFLTAVKNTTGIWHLY